MQELTCQACVCDGADGGCFHKFKDVVEKVVGLRTKLKSMPPGESDLTVVNMLHGSSELDLSDDEASASHRVSDSDADEPPELVMSTDDEAEPEKPMRGEERVDDSDGRVDSEDGSGSCEPPKPAPSSHKRRPRKGRYEHKILGRNVCRRALLKLLGCAHPAGAGKLRKGDGRWFCLSTSCFEDSHM